MNQNRSSRLLTKIGIGRHAVQGRRRGRCRSPSLELLEARILLQGNPTHLLTDHVYQHLVIRVNGEPVEIPADIGVDADGPVTSPYTLTAGGVIHQSPIDGTPPDHYATLGDFFSVWRDEAGRGDWDNPDATFSATELMGNQADQEHTIRMFVNGVSRDEFESYVLWNGDQIVLSYESLPAYPAPVIDPINDVTMPAGHTFAVPINASARGHGPLTFTADSSDGNLLLEPLAGGPSARLTVQIPGDVTQPAPDFLLPDLNPNSDTYQQQISRDTFQGEVVGYYFTHPG